MMSQEAIAITLMKIKVFRLPIFSDKKPEIGLPTGHIIAVIEANHETCEGVKITSASARNSSCVVIAGKPKPIPDESADRLARNEITICKVSNVFRRKLHKSCTLLALWRLSV